jgi:hypothetical protein
MRTIILAVTVGLLSGYATATFAAQSPTIAACESLADKRGSGAGTGAGTGAHKAFIASCLAGRVSFVSDVKPPTAKQKLQAQSYDKCEALAEERGSTIEDRAGFHDFISQCMAGKIH